MDDKLDIPFAVEIVNAFDMLLPLFSVAATLEGRLAIVVIACDGGNDRPPTLTIVTGTDGTGVGRLQTTTCMVFVAMAALVVVGRATVGIIDEAAVTVTGGLIPAVCPPLEK